MTLQFYFDGPYFYMDDSSQSASTLTSRQPRQRQRGAAHKTNPKTPKSDKFFNLHRWLLAKGIDFGLVNHAGHGAVHKAAWKGHEEALAWMIEDEEGPKLAYQVILFTLSAAQRKPLLSSFWFVL